MAIEISRLGWLESLAPQCFIAEASVSNQSYHTYICTYVYVCLTYSQRTCNAHVWCNHEHTINSPHTPTLHPHTPECHVSLHSVEVCSTRPIGLCPWSAWRGGKRLLNMQTSRWIQWRTIVCVCVLTHRPHVNLSTPQRTIVHTHTHVKNTEYCHGNKNNMASPKSYIYTETQYTSHCFWASCHNHTAWTLNDQGSHSYWWVNRPDSSKD